MDACDCARATSLPPGAHLAGCRAEARITTIRLGVLVWSLAGLAVAAAAVYAAAFVWSFFA